MKKMKKHSEWTVSEAKEAMKNAEMALAHLCRARDLLVKSQNAQTAARVRHAISSAKGAVRINHYRLTSAIADPKPVEITPPIRVVVHHQGLSDCYTPNGSEVRTVEQYGDRITIPADPLQ